MGLSVLRVVLIFPSGAKSWDASPKVAGQMSATESIWVRSGINSQEFQPKRSDGVCCHLGFSVAQETLVRRIDFVTASANSPGLVAWGAIVTPRRTCYDLRNFR